MEHFKIKLFKPNKQNGYYFITNVDELYNFVILNFNKLIRENNLLKIEARIRQSEKIFLFFSNTFLLKYTINHLLQTKNIASFKLIIKEETTILHFSSKFITPLKW